MSIINKYRPKSFKKFYGNKELVQSIQKRLDKNDFPKAVLFAGPSGCGKTTLARIVAKKLGANDSGIIEMNYANTRGIETAREINENAAYCSFGSGIKVYILDEFHMATSEAANALLKIVEEPPSHVYFMFCTTNPEKIPHTLKTRLARYDVKLLNDEDGMMLIDYVADKEGIKVFKDIARIVLQYSEGCPRRILSNMQKCEGLSLKEAENLLQNSIEGVKDEAVAICRMFFNPKSITWKFLMDKVDNLAKTESAESIRRMMFAYFAKCLKGAKNNGQVALFTNILEVIESPIREDSQAINALVYMLGKIYCGVLMSE